MTPETYIALVCTHLACALAGWGMRKHFSRIRRSRFRHAPRRFYDFRNR
jgi:hypothetical protein